MKELNPDWDDNILQYISIYVEGKGVSTLFCQEKLWISIIHECSVKARHPPSTFPGFKTNSFQFCIPPLVGGVLGKGNSLKDYGHFGNVLCLEATVRKCFLK